MTGANALQVVLAGARTKVVAAVKELIYTGTCFLDKVPEFSFSSKLVISFVLSLTSRRFWRHLVYLGWKYPGTASASDLSWGVF